MTGCSSNYYRQIPGKIYPAQQVSGANLTRNSGYYSKKGLFWLEFRMLWRIFEYPFPITGAFTNINFPSAGVTRWKELRFFLNGSAFPLQYKHMFHRLGSHNRQQKKSKFEVFAPNWLAHRSCHYAILNILKRKSQFRIDISSIHIDLR